MNHEITEQQWILAVLVGYGYSNKQISRTVRLSYGTVKNLLWVLYGDLGISGCCKRAKLAAMVAEGWRQNGGGRHAER